MSKIAIRIGLRFLIAALLLLAATYHPGKVEAFQVSCTAQLQAACTAPGHFFCGPECVYPSGNEIFLTPWYNACKAAGGHFSIQSGSGTVTLLCN